MNDVSQLPNRKPLPSRALVTAGELLLWLAFGDYSLSDPIGAAAFNDVWGFDISLEEGSEEKLYLALREAAQMLDPWEEEAFVSNPSQPIWLGAARRLVATSLGKRGMTAVEALAPFNVDRDRLRRRQKAIGVAEASVIEALVADRLQVLASPADPTWPQTASGSARKVSADFFATQGVRIALDGTISAPCDPGYVHAQFRAAQVLAVWVGPDRQALSIGCQPPSQHLSTAAAEWMRSHVTEPGAWKRDSAMERCRADTKATFRQARDAWDALPDSLRGRRGAHK